MRNKIVAISIVVIMLCTLFAIAESTAQTNVIVKIYGEHAEALDTLVAANKMVIDESKNNTNFKAVSDSLGFNEVAVFTDFLSGNNLTNVPVFAKNHFRAPFLENATDSENCFGTPVFISSTTEEPAIWFRIVQGNGEIFDYASPIDIPEMRQHILQKVASQVNEFARPKGLMANAIVDNTWNHKYTFDYPYLFGSLNPPYNFIDMKAAIYQYTHADDAISREFWRIDSHIEHTMETYVQGGTGAPVHVGPYIKDRWVGVNTGIQMAPNTGFYSYEPQNQISTSSVSWTIGLTAYYGGGSFEASYSHQWEQPEVQGNVIANYDPYSYIHWDQAFTEPTYATMQYPYYTCVTPPAPLSHNSFVSDYSSVYLTPLGSGFPGGTQSHLWTIYDDFVPYHRDIYTFPLDINVGSWASMFV